MGYIVHHAIVVTGTYGDWIQQAHAEAVRIFAGSNCVVSNVTEPAVNATQSFLVAPDGSKEGWDASDNGNNLRGVFVAWLRSQRYEDGSSPLNWVLLAYPGDDDAPVIVTHSKVVHMAIKR